MLGLRKEFRLELAIFSGGEDYSSSGDALGVVLLRIDRESPGIQATLEIGKRAVLPKVVRRKPSSQDGDVNNL